ncbi:nucleotidyltransferase domain-containing protein [Mycolicibacterium porcinum]|uniref:nucleotidyltransferase domain-containing protein n=1 Tax=Mycolicibacterium porcinum TaxID=39693 RepID=UPI0009F533C8|nr:nucleotidyltransferase domain-containing protein [Mycolicibacterium porcinum]
MLYEPVQGMFNTQHSTPDNKKIAEDGLILLTEVGSTLHGVSTTANDDDVDEMGICIEPPTSVIGLGKFEQYEYRTQPVNHRSHAGDIDRTVYSLRKWTKLAAGGNPTVLMPLFAPSGKVRYSNDYGQLVVANRDRFLTKKAGRKFLGYLDGQMQRFLDPARTDSKHATRPELIDAHGWDTKTGYHALRLAIQGHELMTDHTITLPMSDSHREFLLAVRSGHYSKEWVTEQLKDKYVPSLELATDTSLLPDEPNYAEINTWLTDTHRSFWDENGW